MFGELHPQNSIRFDLLSIYCIFKVGLIVQNIRWFYVISRFGRFIGKALRTISAGCFVIAINRSSHRRCSMRKAVLKIFFNIYRKTPVLKSLLNNVNGLQAYNFIKKSLQYWLFPKFLRTAILKSSCERLLLHQVPTLLFILQKSFGKKY